MSWNDFSAHIGYLSASDRERVERAFEMGKRAHEGQTRKSGEPYFTHPIAIAERLAGMGADGDTLIAALLHDTVEDTPVTLEEIEAAFGPTVRILIDGVTKLTADDLTSPSHDEQIETLRKMFTLMQTDVRIMVIKLIDRWHNMTTAEGLSPERRRSFAQETLDTIVKIADRLSMKELREELTALSLSILDPAHYRELESLREEFRTLAKNVVDAMEKTLRPTLPKGVKVYSKPLSWEKTDIIQRLGSGSGKAEMTAVFTCPDIATCYTVLGLIHQTWPLQRLTFDDYINAPAMNGYRGIHTTVILQNGMRVRCKIRTTAMDTYDRLGVVMYCFQPRNKVRDMHLLPWTDRISPLAEGTTFQSEAFWTSLQRDLLGEEIVVYGSSEQSVTIPRGATALDAAFYLFGEQAIYAGSIRINGQDVAFDAELSNGDVLDLSFLETVQANREWLTYVQSGLASTLIRQELAKAPEAEKILLGNTLLDVGLRRHGLPSISELQPQVFSDGLASLGMSHLDELFIQLAEGKMSVPQALTIFASPLGTQKRGIEIWNLRLKLKNRHESDRWLTWLRTLAPRSLSVHEQTNGEDVAASLSLSQGQADSIDSYLHSRLSSAQWKLSRRGLQLRIALTATLLVILWGLDPVFAHALLTQHISVPSLTVIRFAAFLAVTLVAHFSLQRANQGRLMPISPLSPPLLASGIALFVTTVGSYAALKSISPTTYILTIVAGVLMTAVVRSIIKKEPVSAVMAGFSVVLGCIVLNILITPPTPFSLFAAVLGSAGFVSYSIASQQYQKVVSLRTRYPTFLLWVSLVGLACSAAIVPWTPFDTLTPFGIGLSLAFVLVFSVLPYILYFEIMRLTDSRLLDRLLPLVIVSTVIGDLFINTSWWALLGLPAMLTVGWILWRHSITDEIR